MFKRTFLASLIGILSASIPVQSYSADQLQTQTRTKATTQTTAETQTQTQAGKRL
jgi:hypothetical protein